MVKISHVFQAVATGAFCPKLEFENHKKNNISLSCLDPNTLRQIFLEISWQNWPFKIGLSLFDFKQLLVDSGTIVQWAATSFCWSPSLSQSLSPELFVIPIMCNFLVNLLHNMVDLSHTLSTHWQELFTFFLHVFCCYFVPQSFQASSVT